MASKMVKKISESTFKNNKIDKWVGNNHLKSLPILMINLKYLKRDLVSVLMKY